MREGGSGVLLTSQGILKGPCPSATRLIPQYPNALLGQMVGIISGPLQRFAPIFCRSNKNAGKKSWYGIQKETITSVLGGCVVYLT